MPDFTIEETTMPNNIHIEVSCGDTPISNVEILMLFPNNTYRVAHSDEFGKAGLYLYTLDDPMTVYAAKDGYCAYLEKNWDPTTKNIKIEMKKLPEGGSVICERGTTNIPCLQGRLNPIYDTSGRTYLYADNIGINGGQTQPVPFSNDKDLHLKDSIGNEYNIRIISICGRSSLIEYSLPDIKT